MHNSSIFVSDTASNLYAVGYRHGGEAVTATEIIESAIAANSDETIIAPVEFLAEWHRLNLQHWDNPSVPVLRAIQEHDAIADKDEHHFEVEMENGKVLSIRGLQEGVETFHLILRR